MENCSGAVLLRTGVRESNLFEHQKSVGLCRSLKENGHRPGLPQPSFMCTGKGSTVPHADEDHIRQHLSCVIDSLAIQLTALNGRAEGE